MRAFVKPLLVGFYPRRSELRDKTQLTTQASLRSSGAGCGASSTIPRGAGGKQPRGVMPRWRCEPERHFSSQGICFMLREMHAAPHCLCQSSPLFCLCPACSRFFSSKSRVGQGCSSPHLPSCQLLWADPTTCREVPLVHRSLRVSPQGGGHDLQISQTAQKISIKTRIVGGSGHGAKGEGRKRVEIVVCQGERRQKVLVMRNVLPMLFVSLR